MQLFNLVSDQTVLLSSIRQKSHTEPSSHFRFDDLKYDLLNYDIMHLDWGLEFYRDGRFVQKLAAAGKPIVCTYNGQDLRTRGVIPAIDAASSLNLTSELDLLKKHPDIKYLFLK